MDSAQEPIEVGDLLTTSETVGHAMKATDLDKAFGAIMGKALAPFSQGRGLILPRSAKYPQWTASLVGYQRRGAPRQNRARLIL